MLLIRHDLHSRVSALLIPEEALSLPSESSAAIYTMELKAFPDRLGRGGTIDLAFLQVRQRRSRTLT
jgi:hypothetical protein